MNIFKHTKEIIFLLITVAVIIKLLITDISNISLTSNISDFISLTLALFSIGLSALFYFRANETSNQFYDNTYQFTKDISEKIGRIEERFGKDLNNIEKGYSRMLDKIEKLPLSQSIQEEIITKASNEQELIEEKEEIIKDLLQKANLSEEEKMKVMQMLTEKEDELEKVKSRLYALNEQLNQIKKSDILTDAPHTRNVLLYIIKSLSDSNELPQTFESFIRALEKAFKRLNNNDVAILIQEGIINPDQSITPRGRKIISRLFNEVS